MNLGTMAYGKLIAVDVKDLHSMELEDFGNSSMEEQLIEIPKNKFQIELKQKQQKTWKGLPELIFETPAL